MAGPNATESPLEVAADTAGMRAIEVFSLLASETRLAIMLALWEAFDPFAEGKWDPQSEANVVSFSDLRERVGMPDSGKFNFHLGKLTGQFVEQTPDGYKLLPAGNKIVRTVIASAGFEETELAPTEIDLACPNCGNPTAVAYQKQRVYWVCTACEGDITVGEWHPSGVLAAWISHPAILSHRTPEAIRMARETGVHHEFAQFAAGVCPWCMGQVESTLHVCDDHDPGADDVCRACGRQWECAARFVCTICKLNPQVDLQRHSEHNPSVIAFYREHGINLNDLDMETLRRLEALRADADHDSVSTDPPRVRVTFRREGDELQLTYDEELNVVAVTRETTP